MKASKDAIIDLLDSNGFMYIEKQCQGMTQIRVTESPRGKIEVCTVCFYDSGSYVVNGVHPATNKHFTTLHELVKLIKEQGATE